MKRKTANQLSPLLKAKTQIERYAFEEIKAEKKRALDRARDLQSAALAAREDPNSDVMAGYFTQNEKHITHALARSKSELERAESMAEPLAQKRKVLQSALQKELALKKIAAALDVSHRKARNKTEERQHELIRALQRGDH